MQGVNGVVRVLSIEVPQPTEKGFKQKAKVIYKGERLNLHLRSKFSETMLTQYHLNRDVEVTGILEKEYLGKKFLESGWVRNKTDQQEPSAPTPEYLDVKEQLRQKALMQAKKAEELEKKENTVVVADIQFGPEQQTRSKEVDGKRLGCAMHCASREMAARIKAGLVDKLTVDGVNGLRKELIAHYYDTTTDKLPTED